VETYACRNTCIAWSLDRPPPHRWIIPFARVRAVRRDDPEHLPIAIVADDVQPYFTSSQGSDSGHKQASPSIRIHLDDHAESNRRPSIGQVEALVLCMDDHMRADLVPAVG